MSRATTCIDCLALPEFPGAYYVEEGVTYRPTGPRKIDPRSTPRRPRCTTHWRAWNAAQKAARADKRVQRIYDLAPGQYAALLAAQGGTCAFPRCRANGTRKRLAVDHDHETNEVRGLLCGPHNYDLLGRFVNDLRDALAYLDDPPARRLELG